ncbi:neuromedin-B-like [Nycticebus coucang]|uniref:neuromedin-B-like n=1 Tax=Nycticebus coucang TaxID=9470 RepID=UPI00234D6A10|nr:neuromedin-B-like [Nycticebus coucang]
MTEIYTLIYSQIFEKGFSKQEWFSFSGALPEPCSQAGKIRVHPRGNLWATGHFMGKKSLEPSSLFPFGTAPHTFLRDQRPQLSNSLLRILLLKKALGMSLSGPAPYTQVNSVYFSSVQDAADANTAEVTAILGQTR